MSINVLQGSNFELEHHSITIIQNRNKNAKRLACQLTGAKSTLNLQQAFFCTFTDPNTRLDHRELVH